MYTEHTWKETVGMYTMLPSVSSVTEINPSTAMFACEPSRNNEGAQACQCQGVAVAANCRERPLKSSWSSMKKSKRQWILKKQDRPRSICKARTDVRIRLDLSTFSMRDVSPSHTMMSTGIVPIFSDDAVHNTTHSCGDKASVSF